MKSRQKSKIRLLVYESANDGQWYLSQISLSNGKVIWDAEGSNRKSNAIKRMLHYRSNELRQDKLYLFQVQDRAKKVLYTEWI